MNWRKFQQAFLWFDEDNPEDLKSYRLPIADVISGELIAIPKGVFAAAGMLLGTEDEEGLPDNVRSRVISNIEQYYSKMDLESPFKVPDINATAKSFNVALLSAATNAKEYEQALREVGFSGSEAKAITAKIGPQREVEASGMVAALKAANEELTNL